MTRVHSFRSSRMIDSCTPTTDHIRVRARARARVRTRALALALCRNRALSCLMPRRDRCPS